MKLNILIWGKRLLLTVFLTFLGLGASYGGTIDPDNDGHKYAWGENTGWKNFNPDSGPGVTVSSSSVTGYAWAENIGWINMSPATGGVFHDGDGLLYGWAWGENVGWISFSCENTDTCFDGQQGVDYGVSIDFATGIFSGYAWGENIGWINFEHVHAASYGVVTGAPNLTAVKSNDVSDETNVEESWNWQIIVANDGDAPALFFDDAEIFRDVLPSEGVTYETPVVSDESGLTGNYNCLMPVANEIVCEVDDPNGFTMEQGGGFTVTVEATPSSPGQKINPTGGDCMVDPNADISEKDETDNDCYDDVQVKAPNLVVEKDNDVNGEAVLGQTWTWQMAIANTGGSPAVFQQGQVLFRDELPYEKVEYSEPAAADFVDITGSISCAMQGDNTNVLVCTANGGSVSIDVSGSFNATVTATPTQTGANANPINGGICMVDPEGKITETDDGDNSCIENVVTVTAPNLSVAKSNTVNGQAVLGNAWQWRMDIANGGDAPATFASGQTIFKDYLPSDGVSYSNPGATGQTGIEGSGAILCVVEGEEIKQLECRADGGDVIVGLSGGFRAQVEASPTTTGTKTNPTGGVCQVDPDGVIVESDDNNNDCNEDAVVVEAPDLTAVKGASVEEAVFNEPWDWYIDIANQGDSPALFASGATIFVDNLPSDGVGYDGAQVTGKTGITGSIFCGLSGVRSNVLTCTASGSVEIAASGGFRVTTAATATMPGEKVNPTGGLCMVDPGDAIPESGDDSNNNCSHTVNVLAPDLTVAKTNSTEGGNTRLGFTWEWYMDVKNEGDSPAVFDPGDVVFTDVLPTEGVTCEGAEVSAQVDTTGNIGCSLGGEENNVITCTATDSFSILAGGGFRVATTATPSTTGTKTNPDGGICRVDPDGNITESSDDNNDCQDEVTVDEAPEDYYVEPLGVCGSKTPCFSSIQDAIDAAYGSPVIHIAEGEYNENVVQDRSSTLDFGWDADFTQRNAQNAAELKGP